MLFGLLYWVLFLLVLGVGSGSGGGGDSWQCCFFVVKVNKYKLWIEILYYGVIIENNDIVILDLLLVVLDKDVLVFFVGEICVFKIYGQELFFEVVVFNKILGEGWFCVRSFIDCELQKEYIFIIQVYDCGVGFCEMVWKKLYKVVVYIQVKDVNEFVFIFKELVYKVVVMEGKIYDSILQVEVVDEDCFFQYSQICNYEIVIIDVFFVIDRNGNIRNIEKLSYDK